MRRSKGFTLVELLVVVGIIGLLAAILVPTLQQAQELTNRTVCMSNLASIGKALTLYKGTNDNDWPWLTDKCTGWESNEVGMNRKPEQDPNTQPERSLTGLMFLLVRENQPVKLFVCPSSDNKKDENIKDTENASDDEEPKYFWDFSFYYNVSYSWQTPIKDTKNNKYRQGVNDNDNDTVVIADKSPEFGDETWENSKWDPDMTGTDVEPHMSQNHSRGKQVNALYVGMNAAKSTRPDIGFNKDMIYTSSNKTRMGSRDTTSKSLSGHLSTRDTFLWGPCSGGADANSGT